MRLWFARDKRRYRNVFWMIDWLIDWRTHYGRNCELDCARLQDFAYTVSKLFWGDIPGAPLMLGPQTPISARLASVPIVGTKRPLACHRMWTKSVVGIILSKSRINIFFVTDWNLLGLSFCKLQPLAAGSKRRKAYVGLYLNFGTIGHVIDDLVVRC